MQELPDFSSELTEQEKNLDPTDVLQEQMVFYRDKSLQLAQLIIEKIKNDPKHRGDQLVAVYKQMTRAREMTIKVATELAPYRKPKLQSVEVKTQVEHKYILRAPEPIAETGDWLKLVGAADKPPIITTDKRVTAAIALQKPKEYTDMELVELADDVPEALYTEDEE